MFKKEINLRDRIVSAILVLVMSLTSFIGTTFAWFTDSVTSGSNVIKPGNLDANMYYSDELLDVSDSNWKNADGVAVFNHQNWEPGYTEVKYVKIENAGDLAFKWMLSIEAGGEVGILADVIDVYYVNPVNAELESLDGLTSSGNLSDVIAKHTSTNGVILPKGKIEPGLDTGAVVLAIAMHMQESAGNKYQDETVCDEGFLLKLVATQYNFEKDSYDESFDKDATWDDITSVGSVKVPVTTNAAGELTATVNGSFAGGAATYTLPAGMKFKPGTTEATVSISNLANESNLSIENGEERKSIDVHVDGVADENTVAAVIEIGEALPKGLNLGNYKLYHFEEGVANQMMLASLADVDAHNEFAYDPVTGNVTVAMATYSEVALVADTENAWEGNFDDSWYDASKTELTIANADQLAAFGAIVGGMKFKVNGVEKDYTEKQDSFSGKTVTLVNDINLGDDEKNNDEDKIFYPIGYYNSEGTYERTNTAITSGLRNFEGTFDGNGNTISNFYQNTWEMKGDHDWYSPEEQYYRDGMGLFGRVYKGTVKNLTVKNFSSDGEIATTGVIAAYADGATFENIAIFNCNPRVYNIGNGGIVGCVGWYAKEANLQTTFTNITVDNSNKISALWGSYDVACGGIVGQYYPTSGQTSAGTPKNAGIHFENCHISAQMDVYNDVCANYQYYAYRYTGMLIGSVRENETKDGHVYPKMDGITASGCTVHFGTWNDYYYCEIIDNTTASYTHDYQMSRLTEIKAIDGTTITYLDGTTGTVPASGRANYVIVDYTKGHGTDNATCYHFKDGAVWTHDMGGIQTGIDENGDGKDDLKEDKQHIYLEFNNLVTGYGWGVTTKGVGDLDGVTILDRAEGNSVEKFEVRKTELTNNRTYTLSEIFAFVDNGVELVPGALAIGITNLDENGNVIAEIDYDRTNWENSTIEFTGTGKIKITIQDYYFCTPTEVTVNITERQPEVKFDVVMNNGDFLHRVGNVGTVPLDKLFKAKDGMTIADLEVKVEEIAGQVTASVGSNKKLEDINIQFSGTGVVKVTITDNDYCTPTELILEVVDAVNATGATNATENNVVLLNNCGFGSLEVSGGYTLYGNGFTMTCGSDSAALDTGYAFVTLDNGSLDNVQIVCPNFDYAVLYKSNMTESGNRSETTDRTRYFNVKSGVMVSGNSQILNSRISGGRAAVNVTGGNCLIDNSRVELGAVASLLVGAANSVTLRDVTLVQKPTASTHDSSKTLMGFSVLFVCDAAGNAAPVTIEGTLIQNAWVDENDKQYVPSAGESIISTVLGKTEYLHDLDGDGTKESLNLGFAYMPESLTSKVNATTITDNRTNKDEIPYDYAEISILNGKTYVYSYKNTNGTADNFKEESEYTPNKYSDIITVNYTDVNENRVLNKVYGDKGWIYQLVVDLDQGAYTFDFSKLTVQKNGEELGISRSDKLNVEEGTTECELTLTDGSTVLFKLIGIVTTKDAPKWSNDANGSTLSTSMNASWEAGLCVASSKGGTWSGAAPALQNIYIRYYSTEAKAYKVIHLADYTPNVTGKVNGSNTTCTITGPDFTLTLTGGQVHSSNKVNAIPVVCNGKLYFVAATSSGLVNSGNSARSVPVSYSFTDGFGNTLTGSYTWSVEENQDDEYSYSDFCNGTLTKLENSSGGSSSCITPDTLVTLADGTQVRVDSLTGSEELLVWNMETGKLDKAPIMFVDSDPTAEYEIIHLYFSDGTDVKVIYEHGFWDYDLNRYVYLDKDAADYIGHTFAKQNGDKLDKVQLVDVVIETEVTEAWSPVTAGHLCYFVNGMLSMPGGVGGLFNIFEVDPETMTYDYEAIEKDIETYGLYTYEELNALCPLSEKMFVEAGGAYLKISIGKGNLTEEELFNMINRYNKFFE